MHRDLLRVLSFLFVSSSFASIARALPGDLDLSYGNAAGFSGYVSTDFTVPDSDDEVIDVVSDSAGRLVVAVQTASGAALVRYDSSGRLDPTFASSSAGVYRFDSLIIERVLAIDVDSDDRILVYGSRSSMGANAVSLARIRDGRIDDTFASGGARFLTLDTSWTLRDLAVARDGSMLLVGDDGAGSVALRAFDADGSDLTTGGFSATGRKTIRFAAPASASAALRGALSGWLIGVETAGDGVVMRLGSSGATDAGFGSMGRVSFDLGGIETVSALAIDRSRRIYVGGNTSRLGSERGYVHALGANGAARASFGTSGSLFLDAVSLGTETVTGLTVGSTGAVASTTCVVGTCLPWVSRFDAATGVVDSTFDSDGLVVVPDVSGESRVAFGSSSGVTIVGEVTSGDTDDVLIVGFDSSGRLDATFGDSGGITRTDLTEPSEDMVTDLVLDPLDRAVSLYERTTSGDGLVSRTLSNGVLDTAFGVGGYTTLDAGASEIFMALAIDASGRAIIVGSTYDSTGSDVVVARLTPQGELDPTFDGDGFAKLDIGAVDVGLAVALHGSAILVTGSADGDGLALVLDDSGALAVGAMDAFGVAGHVLLDGGGNETISAVAIASDGDVVLAGYDTTPDFLMARIEAGGTLDDGFVGPAVASLRTVVPGFFFFDLRSATETMLSLIVDSSDRIVGSAKFTPATDEIGMVFRMLPDGSFDSTFATGGILEVFPVTTYSAPRIVAVHEDSWGRLVLCAEDSRWYPRAVSAIATGRLLDDGSWDPTYSATGLIYTPAGPSGGAGAMMSTCALDSTDGIILGGIVDEGGIRGVDAAIARVFR